LCCPNILLPIHLWSTAGNACLSLRVFSLSFLPDCSWLWPLGFLDWICPSVHLSCVIFFFVAINDPYLIYYFSIREKYNRNSWTDFLQFTFGGLVLVKKRKKSNISVLCQIIRKL
jgi:hypothetical protein